MSNVVMVQNAAEDIAMSAAEGMSKAAVSNMSDVSC